jgi:hypothetical protein
VATRIIAYPEVLRRYFLRLGKSPLLRLLFVRNLFSIPLVGRGNQNNCLPRSIEEIQINFIFISVPYHFIKSLFNEMGKVRKKGKMGEKQQQMYFFSLVFFSKIDNLWVMISVNERKTG